jgi:thiaminase
MTTFTERLRDAAGKTWQDVVEHPFTGAKRAGTDCDRAMLTKYNLPFAPDALARGDIDEDAMRYYLIQDHRFIDDFVVLLASMVCCPRSCTRARTRPCSC